jgi:hypothetical protein
VVTANVNNAGIAGPTGEFGIVDLDDAVWQHTLEREIA